jgi:hypothetical protein
MTQSYREVPSVMNDSRGEAAQEPYLVLLLKDALQSQAITCAVQNQIAKVRCWAAAAAAWLLSVHCIVAPGLPRDELR